jgi:hypothetical protein
LQSLGFLPSKADISLFHYHKGSITMFLLVYADDIIIAISSSHAVDALLQDLKSDFAPKDMDSLHYFLVIEVTLIADGICLSHSRYTSDLLKRVGMISCKGRPLHCCDVPPLSKDG